MVKAKEQSQIERDAAEFGVGVRCGGWRLGLLVARSCAPGKAGRPSNRSLENDSDAKLSFNQFAEIAGVSVSHVKYYYDAWELAAHANLVPAADKIEPGDEDIDIEADSIEVEDNPRTHWSHFYQLAKNPPAKKEQKEKKQKPVDDSIDDDFGISEPVMTEDEAAEADSSIMRNELLEVLESVRSLGERLVRIGAVPDDKDGLLNQISSAAMDLSTAAMGMSVVSEKVEV